MTGVTPAEFEALIAILVRVPRDDVHFLLDRICPDEALAGAIREQLPRNPDLLKRKLLSDLRGLLIARGERRRDITLAMETEIRRAAASSTKGEVRPTDAAHELCRKILPLLRNSSSPNKPPICGRQIRNLLDLADATLEITPLAISKQRADSE